eukprot:TRINITY_DN2740_c0_g2_i5.p1 TRINITY_DN2740_c0_g2~~TRINITY_DN2740_c0_g2_i5.p1  ORF type:complete len:134 (-),score=25.38 TRINITY_DN2740_c0_g2_i5:109-510(-)
MYYAKKNGKPKPDYPPFFNEQVLSKSHIKLITLQEKGPEALVKPSMSLLVPQAVVQERTASSKATQMKEPPKIRSERPSAAEKTLFTGIDIDGDEYRPVQYTLLQKLLCVPCVDAIRGDSRTFAETTDPLLKR